MKTLILAALLLGGMCSWAQTSEMATANGDDRAVPQVTVTPTPNLSAEPVKYSKCSSVGLLNQLLQGKGTDREKSRIVEGLMKCYGGNDAKECPTLELLNNMLNNSQGDMQLQIKVSNVLERCYPDEFAKRKRSLKREYGKPR